MRWAVRVERMGQITTTTTTTTYYYLLLVCFSMAMHNNIRTSLIYEWISLYTEPQMLSPVSIMDAILFIIKREILPQKTTALHNIVHATNFYSQVLG
jgi:hypothetical protein